MKKNKTKIITTILLIILLLSTTLVYAENETSNTTAGENGIVTTDDVQLINENTATPDKIQGNNYKSSDDYIFGEDVTIDYLVDGNIFVCAKNVTIKSQIGGDAFIIAENITIEEEAYVFSNVFALAKSIEVKGVIYDIYSCSEKLTISGGHIYRDMKAACRDFNFSGTIGRNGYLSCENMNFNTDENSKSMIYGNLNYTSSSEKTIPENIVTGEVKFTQENLSEELTITEIISNYILSLGEFLVFASIIWLLCLWLAPKFLSYSNNYVGKSSLKVLCIGLLGLIAIPIICIILILLDLTSSISLILLALYIIGIALAKSIFTIVANNYICSKLNLTKNIQIFGMLVISEIVVWILTNLPFVGDVISFIVCILGLGILISSIISKKDTKPVEIAKN